MARAGARRLRRPAIANAFRALRTRAMTSLAPLLLAQWGSRPCHGPLRVLRSDSAGEPRLRRCVCLDATSANPVGAWRSQLVARESSVAGWPESTAFQDVGVSARRGS